MQSLVDQIGAQFAKVASVELWVVLKALGVLVVGWLVALGAAALVRTGLKRTTLDNRLAAWVAGEKAKGLEVERWVAQVVYYVILIFVLVAFFNTLNLTLVSQPLQSLLDKVVGYIPNLAVAAALLLGAWAVATGLRRVVGGALDIARIDERLGGQAGLAEAERLPLSQTLADTIYWLVFLLFLPAILESLSLEGLLAPVQSIVDRVLSYLPNVLAAGIIVAAGWFIARIVQRIVTNLLAAVGTDRLGDRIGLSQTLGARKLSGLIGLLVYVLILIPVVIQSLNALSLDAITRPATDMLGRVMDAIPAIFAAGLLLTLAYVAGRLVAGLIANLLAGAGFNGVLSRIGLAGGAVQQEGPRSPSAVVGTLVLVAVMLFASIEAGRLLGFDSFAALLSGFVVFAGQVILGLIVFGVGLYLANLAATAVQASGAPQAGLLAAAARVSILVLAGAIALRQMGLANEIIQLAFGLLLGAVAVAVALAFGLGGRDVAGRQIEGWVESMRSRKAGA
jgi:Mechanosensitive ion channel, conserved TM helix